MQSFVISPSEGFAGVLNAKEGTVQLVLPASLEGREMPACNYFSRFASTAVVEVENVSAGIELFDNYKTHSQALDFALLLLDVDISAGTRLEVARELDELLEDSGTLDYVLDILLAAPLPRVADTDGATIAAKRFRRTRLFIDTVIECQVRVQYAYDAWLAIRNDDAVNALGADAVRGRLIQHGVFRQLVLDGKTRQDRAALNARIVLGLQEQIQPRITTDLLRKYFACVPEGVRIARPVETSAEREYLEPNAETSSTNVREIGGADARLARVETQIERVAELFSQRKDQVANQFLDELVDSQTRNTSDHSYVVKSLCNIATKCDVRGRRDVSFACLSRARQYTSGIDAVLYLQIGNALRGIRKLSDALACYETARDLDDGAYRDEIELDSIRVTVMKGEYKQALQKLSSLVGTVAYPPPYYAQMGKLFRHVGDLRSARENYWNAINFDPEYHTAYAGLAEANKQSGRHFKAIRRYQSLIRDFPNLDEGSAKVYDLARSQLFRLTHQSKLAFSILTGLNAKFPSDAEVHLQLAKLYLLEGDTDRARWHFEHAKGPNLEEIAAKLFLVAEGKHIDLPNPDSNVIDSGVPPEDNGLLRCSRALIAIEKNNFEEARRVVVDPNYCDRLQSDFGAVLGFHAQKKIDPSIHYKGNQILCRIAKRGYRELKHSVAAIGECDFDTARKLERRMCLLIA